MQTVVDTSFSLFVLDQQQAVMLTVFIETEPKVFGKVFGAQMSHHRRPSVQDDWL